MTDITDGLLTLSEEDLKELFSLFTSVTEFERDQVYDEKSDHHFKNIELFEEYTLTEEKREYALDIWRAVTYFLYRKGYSLYKDGETVSLSFSDHEFVS